MAVAPARERTFSRPDRPVHASRSMLVLLTVATAVGSMGLAAGGTAGALLAAELTGSPAAAGLPLGVLVACTAIGAVIISRRTARAGRAAGLLFGYLAGVAGAAVVVAAAQLGSFALVLGGTAAMGVANSSVFLARYAAADLVGQAARGRAMGAILFATTVGAVTSPTLLGPSGDVAATIGLPRLAGLYLVAALTSASAAVMLALLARATGSVLEEQPPPHRQTAVQATAEALRQRTARTAVLILGVTNLVMVAVMAIAPIHLTSHHHGLSLVGLVISVHVLGMFAPSPLTGWAADRFGSFAVATVGGLLLIASGLAGALIDQASGLAMMIVLGLLGLGWNAGVVGGSTMLTASAPASIRHRTEAVGEIAMGTAAAAGAPLAGVVADQGGFTSLSLAGALLAALMLATANWQNRSRAGRLARIGPRRRGARAGRTGRCSGWLTGCGR